MALNPISAVEMSLGINRTATKIAIGGFVVMALTIGVMQMLDDARLTFWQLLAGLIGLIVLMMALTVLPQLARRVIAWVLTVCFSFVAITATGQAITSNGCPRLATATCILSFHLAPGCVISRPGAAPGDGAMLQMAPGAAFAGALPKERLFLAQGTTAGPDGARVFIQFAGFPRDQIVKLAQSLLQEGWQVEGADRGGERIKAATGLNEVRFFHPGDADRAAKLAEAAGVFAEGGRLEVVDLSASGYGQAEPGLLEVWISE